MPEGDTVWNTARSIGRAIAGRPIERSDFRTPALASTDLAGWTVLESTCRGKHLLLRLTREDARPLTLHSHLRMDGSWRMFRRGQPLTGRPSHTIRVVLYTADVVAVGFHVHDVRLVPTSEEDRLVGHLGPDLLGADWDPDEAVRRLQREPDRTIADALLDQHNLAGIGNLYKAETLFLRGVSPWTPVSTVDDLPGLVALAHRLLNANRGRWSQATTGSLRPGEGQWVYQRAGKPCRRCRTTIRRHTGTLRAGSNAGNGDQDRVTFWCPSCQPGPAPPGTTRPLSARG